MFGFWGFQGFQGIPGFAGFQACLAAWDAEFEDLGLGLGALRREPFNSFEIEAWLAVGFRG